MEAASRLIFAHGIRKWGKSSVEVEQAIIDGGERQVSQLRSHLRVLNAVATISPLLGLLGTVIGMIQCFNEVASSQAMGKADQLAGGIGIALLATAAGLVIAIPSLTMYMYLAGRVDALIMDMDFSGRTSCISFPPRPSPTVRNSWRRAGPAATHHRAPEPNKRVRKPL